MAGPSSRGAVVSITVVVCAACSWLLLADHGLAWRLGLAEFDLPMRVFTVFVFLSLLDKWASSTSE